VKKFTFLISFIVILIILVVGIGFLLSPQDALEPSDAIVVISGGETQSRVAEGVDLYKNNWAPILIMSGAARDTEGVANAVAMQRLAVDLGVASEDVLIEEESVNTFENAEKTKDIIIENKYSKIILVTSPYHQRRASLVFHKALKDLPIKIINHSATDSAWRKNGWWLNAWARQLTFEELQKVVYTWLVPLS